MFPGELSHSVLHIADKTLCSGRQAPHRMVFLKLVCKGCVLSVPHVVFSFLPPAEINISLLSFYLSDRERKLCSLLFMKKHVL